jgi:hypothetical protein
LSDKTLRIKNVHNILRNGISFVAGNMDVKFVVNVIIIPTCIVKYVRKSLTRGREYIRDVNVI